MPFGLDIRFSQPFQAHRFVLSPRTPELSSRFAGLGGDFTGTVAGAADVGRFRGVLDVPATVPPGAYTLEWEVVDRATGRLGNLVLPVKLRVVSPDAPTPASALAPCSPSSASSLSPATSSSLQATLDGQYPHDAEGRVHVSRGDTVPIGFNIRFNGVFSPNFVLRPNTVASVAHFLPAFGTPGNVFPGAVAPNDDHVGYYRSAVTVPLCTPSGSYFVQWRVYDRFNGREAPLEPSMVVTVP